MVQFLQRKQVITTPYAKALSKAKSQKKPKGNLIQLTPTQDMRKLANLQRINVGRNLTTKNRKSLLLSSIINNKDRTINWSTSKGKKLT